MTSSRPVCVVIGAGPGNGSSLAKRFDQAGYQLALLSRTTTYTHQLAGELKQARAYACDASDSQQIVATLQQIHQETGPVDTLIYNAGSGIWGNLDDVHANDLEQSWRTNVLGAFNAIKTVVPAMREKGSGNVIFIGATASRRGAAGTAAFSQAKAAQRTLAESTAKHLWPDGIHVALVIIDGIVNSAKGHERMPDKPDSFFVSTDGIADIAYNLAQQPRAAWSFEVEARPFAEKW